MNKMVHFMMFKWKENINLIMTIESQHWVKLNIN